MRCIADSATCTPRRSRLRHPVHAIQDTPVTRSTPLRQVGSINCHSASVRTYRVCLTPFRSLSHVERSLFNIRCVFTSDHPTRSIFRVIQLHDLPVVEIKLQLHNIRHADCCYALPRLHCAGVETTWRGRDVSGGKISSATDPVHGDTIRFLSGYVRFVFFELYSGEKRGKISSFG